MGRAFQLAFCGYEHIPSLLPSAAKPLVIQQKMIVVHAPMPLPSHFFRSASISGMISVHPSCGRRLLCPESQFGFSLSFCSYETKCFMASISIVSYARTFTLKFAMLSSVARNKIVRVTPLDLQSSSLTRLPFLCP